MYVERVDVLLNHMNSSHQTYLCDVPYYCQRRAVGQRLILSL